MNDSFHLLTGTQGPKRKSRLKHSSASYFPEALILILASIMRALVSFSSAMNVVSEAC